MLSSSKNEDLTRGEEPTHAPTPDKLDRSMRKQDNKTEDGVKPYPLTEEEATPLTPESERHDHASGTFLSDDNGKGKARKESDEVSSDYNRFVSHPRKR